MQENGSLSRALNGEYDFTIKEVLSEAWKLTDAILIYTIIAVVLSVILSFIFDSKMYYESGQLLKGILSDQAQSLLSLPILAPLMTGIVMLSIKRASHKTMAVLSIFDYYIYVWPLVFASVLINMIVTFGFLMLIIPGIYLSITFVFTIPIMIDKQLGIIDAMKTSFRVVSKRWFKFFGIYILLGFFSLLCIFTLGIGLIWILPFSFITNAVLYRRIFGYSNLERVEDDISF